MFKPTNRTWLVGICFLLCTISIPNRVRYRLLRANPTLQDKRGVCGSRSASTIPPGIPAGVPVMLVGLSSALPQLAPSLLLDNSSLPLAPIWRPAGSPQAGQPNTHHRAPALRAKPRYAQPVGTITLAMASTFTWLASAPAAVGRRKSN